MIKHLFLLFIVPLSLFAQSALITKPNKGKLGDQLSIFSRALYFSYLYNLPLTVTPFNHSELFQLYLLYPSELETPESFEKTVIVTQTHEINPYSPDSLHIVPYYIDNYIEGRKGNPISTPNFNDPEYMELLRTALTPIEPIKLIHPPEDKVTVAIHLRTGEGVDNIYAKKKFSYKFLGKHSAVEMLKSLQKKLPPNTELYVHLFTDVLSPQKKLKWFRKHSPKNIEWGTTYENQSFESVLTDLYSMASFDYIIRPSSNFSLFSLILGHHKKALIGTESHWSDKKKEVVVDKFITTTAEDFFDTYYFN